jgi:hypothetical protein
MKRTAHPDWSRAEVDERDGSLNIYERAQPLFPQAAADQPGLVHHTIWKFLTVSRHQRDFDVQVFVSSIPIKKNESMLETGRSAEDGVYREGIQKWGEPLFKMLLDLGAHGFKLQEMKNGDMVYVIAFRATLRKEGANVTAKIEIAKPGTEPIIKGRYMSGLERAVQFIDDGEVHELSSSMFNHAPRESGM